MSFTCMEPDDPACPMDYAWYFIINIIVDDISLFMFWNSSKVPEGINLNC